MFNKTAITFCHADDAFFIASVLKKELVIFASRMLFKRQVN